MTPASSASLSAFRISPEFTKKNPPGRANALTSADWTTLMVNGTLASEFRTRFCPSRLTYSATMGSSTILDCRSCDDGIFHDLGLPFDLLGQLLAQGDLLVKGVEIDA